jgi:hypothetical protein
MRTGTIEDEDDMEKRKICCHPPGFKPRIVQLIA